MCFICDIVNWIIAYLILSLVGILLFKVILHYQNHDGDVSLTGMALDDKTWERDTRALIAGLIFPFVFWGIASCIRLLIWEICVSTPYRLIT